VSDVAPEGACGYRSSAKSCRCYNDGKALFHVYVWSDVLHNYLSYQAFLNPRCLPVVVR